MLRGAYKVQAGAHHGKRRPRALRGRGRACQEKRGGSHGRPAAHAIQRGTEHYSQFQYSPERFAGPPQALMGLLAEVARTGIG
jgi:hypothetical protein